MSLSNIHKQIGLRPKPPNIRDATCFVRASTNTISRLLPCARPPKLFFVHWCSLDVLVIHSTFSSCACTAAAGATAAWGGFHGPAGTLHCIFGEQQCVAQCYRESNLCLRNSFTSPPPLIVSNVCRLNSFIRRVGPPDCSVRSFTTEPLPG